jgi:hypothetical protein
MTTQRRLTGRQLAKALADIDAQIMRLEYILSDFNAFTVLCPDGIPEYVSDAWNATHDALTALREHRSRVEMNPRPIPSHELGTWELARQNID